MAAARRHGVSTMFTLSGGHVFPVYDGAVTADPPMPIIDVRHEQTAVFAAEATARLTSRNTGPRCRARARAKASATAAPTWPGTCSVQALLVTGASNGG